MRNIIVKIPGFKLINSIRMYFLDKTAIARCYLYDSSKFRKFYTAKPSGKYDKDGLEGWLLQDKHRIEKGLSLPNPRANFGEEVIKRLTDNALFYRDVFGCGDVYYISIGSLLAYESYHKKNNIVLNDKVKYCLSKIPPEDFNNDMCKKVGVFEPFLIENKSEFFNEFVQTRRSCRHFQPEKKISEDVIRDVMTMTIKTPSVCNRQHWKVHIYSGRKKSELLMLQNGNTGFSDNIPYIAVITSDLSAFYMPYERNQPFTDSGMFAMTFMYALHSFGISSCALNWCNPPFRDKKLHKITSIPEKETVSMFIAFGYAAKDNRSAMSPRKKVEEFYTLN